MSMQEVKRPLSELEARVAGLKRIGGALLLSVVDIAVNRLPSAVYPLVFGKLLNCGFVRDEADMVAKAARWLSVIRRDYDEEAFKKVVAEITKD